MINRVRLPVRTKWPQWPEDREVFRLANGVAKTISVTVRKTYQLETGFLPQVLHERLKIALAHDNVTIYNNNLLSGVSQDGPYAVDWPEFQDFPVAKATATIQVTPFNATNSNCKTCEEFAQIVAEDDTFPNPIYESGLQEGAEYSLDVAENDSICCFPAVFSLVSYNSDYLDAASISEAGLLSITLGTGLVAGNNILIATYRVTCPNGDYDDADVYADIDGSEEGCFGPVNLEVSEVTPNSATVTFDAPAVPPATYELFLYLAGDLVTVIYAASAASGPFVIPDLDPETDYVVVVIGNCATGDSSPVQVEFTTPASSTSCGQYSLTMNDGTLDPTFSNITYIDCNGDETDTVVTNSNIRIICALQNAPGDPVLINFSSPFVTTVYLGLC